MNIAKWNGSSWSSVGGGMDAEIIDLAVFDDGGGDALYACGSFITAGGMSVNKIAKWDGSAWSPLGSGFDPNSFFYVWDLEVFDDGGGPALYAAGNFWTAGGVSAKNVAKWDGTTWSALGLGTNDRVLALSALDDGSGNALYAAGFFTSAGGVSASRVAKWDGSVWTALGAGVNSAVQSSAVFDDGSGPALYVGGFFSTAGGQVADSVAKWDGASWSVPGTGLGGGGNVWAMTTYDDGTGTELYAGGTFQTAGGSSVNGIAKWDGSSWSPLGSGVSGGFDPGVYAFGSFDDGSGNSLYVGGRFQDAGGSGSSFLGIWGCAIPGDGNAYCFGDGTGTACPCAANGGPGEGCANSTGVGGAILNASGSASLSSDNFRLQVSGVPGNKPGLILRGANQMNGGLGIAVGDGLLCTGGQSARSQVQVTSAGSTEFADFQGGPFGASSYGAGVPTHYQFWYRNTANTCSGAGFNFSNAWTVTWLP